MTNQFIKHAP